MMEGPQCRKAAPPMPDRAGMGEFLATPMAEPMRSMVVERPTPRPDLAQSWVVVANSLKVPVVPMAVPAKAAAEARVEATTALILVMSFIRCLRGTMFFDSTAKCRGGKHNAYLSAQYACVEAEIFAYFRYLWVV